MFKHCKKCSFSQQHCYCVFECVNFMVYDGCDEFKSNDLNWSVQAERDFIG